MHARSARAGHGPPLAPAGPPRGRPGQPPLLRGLVRRARDPRAGAEARWSAAPRPCRAPARRCCSPPGTSTRTWCWARTTPTCRPPSRSPASASYVRWAWLCEGAAAWLRARPRSRAAIVRRLREGGRPEFPPAPSDAMLLGGTLFSMLEEERGVHVAAALATSPLERGARGLIAEAFDRPWPRSSATGATTWTRSRHRIRVRVARDRVHGRTVAAIAVTVALPACGQAAERRPTRRGKPLEPRGDHRHQLRSTAFT